MTNQYTSDKARAAKASTTEALRAGLNQKPKTSPWERLLKFNLERRNSFLWAFSMYLSGWAWQFNWWLPILIMFGSMIPVIILEAWYAERSK